MRHRRRSGIVGGHQRLTGLINDLFDLAKIEAGRIEWRMAPIRPEDVVRRALAAASARFEVGGVALEERVEDGLPEVTSDEERLVQVVINLVSNDVKFSPAGRVTVAVDRLDDDVRVSVADTGRGILEADLEELPEIGRLNPSRSGPVRSGNSPHRQGGTGTNGSCLKALGPGYGSVPPRESPVNPSRRTCRT